MLHSANYAASQIHAKFWPSKIKPLVGLDLKPYKIKGTQVLFNELKKHGIHLNQDGFARATMDSLQPSITQGTVSVPVQFLQYWLPTAIEIITAPRKIDDAIGYTIAGDWCDEQVVYKTRERSGTAQSYDDYNEIPFADWNVNFDVRTILRFEIGIRVAILEQERAAKMRESPDRDKREAASEALEIMRNSIGFYGFNGGSNLTYGLLNAPGQPAYVTANIGASGFTQWADKTLLEIIADIQQMASGINESSLGKIDPFETPTTLLLANPAYIPLATPSDFGYSVMEYLKRTFPKMRVVQCPQLDAVESGLNGAYLYAENVSGVSETWPVFEQFIQTKFRTLGVEQQVKGYKEGYSMATAGSTCMAPYGLYRLLGV